MEALQGLALFASVVAHEVRNPLSAVKIALQTLDRHSTLGAKDSERLQIALREVGTIEQVLTDVLEWARPGALHREPTTARYILDMTTARIGNEFNRAGIRLEMDARAAPDPFVADPARIADALTELLRNALQAAPGGSVVHVTVSANDRATVFTITDEGRTLTDEDCDRAFDPFYSRRARGVGLGLPRARDIVAQHGGEVSLKRRVTGGARATIRLPLVRP